MYEEFGSRIGSAYVMGSIGSVHNITGNHSLALEHYQRALAASEELGDFNNAAIVMDNIGLLHADTGNHTAALEYHKRALIAFEELGNQASMAHATGNIIAVLITAERHDEADALLQGMDSMHIDNPVMLVLREVFRAAIQEHNSDFHAALATLCSALELAGEHALRSQQVQIHKALRDLALKRNNLQDYVTHNDAFMMIAEEINGKDTATKLAMQEKQREIDAREKEHQKHMAVLHSTLPKNIADRVARGEGVNDHFENAAVLFLDIVGFTILWHTNKPTSHRTTRYVVWYLRRSLCKEQRYASKDHRRFVSGILRIGLHQCPFSITPGLKISEVR